MMTLLWRTLGGNRIIDYYNEIVQCDMCSYNWFIQPTKMVEDCSRWLE